MKKDNFHKTYLIFYYLKFVDVYILKKNSKMPLKFVHLDKL
jgi:hypothetical protein